MKGAYFLVVELEERLERWDLEPGLYLYVGSAWGPGGLLARTKRHLLKSFKRPKWHVDWLTSRGRPLIAFWFPGATEDEAYEVASKLFEPAVKGFGSTDTQHLTHLFKLEPRKLPEALSLLYSLRTRGRRERREST